MSTLQIVCPHCSATNRIPADKELAKANCGKCSKSLMETTPVELHENNFYKHIQKNGILTFVDFYSKRCGPCQMLAPVFQRVAKDFPLRIQFARIDSEVQFEIASSFRLRGVPTLIMFKQGEEIDRITGAPNEIQLREWLTQYV